VAQARANIKKASADGAAADASLANVSGVWRRDKTLIASGVVSAEQAQADEAAVRVATANLAAAGSQLSQAEAGLQSAEAQASFAKATLENYSLRAPYDGVVISRNLELGSAANPGQSLFTVVQAQSIWVLAYVDERLAGRLRVGRPAAITLRSDPARRYPGRIARIEIQSDPVNEERLVDVAFEQIPPNIHLAEQAEVVITTGVLSRAALAPPAAVTGFRGDQAVGGRGLVWTVEKGRIGRRQVSLGPALIDGRLPVLGGLPQGAAVVASPLKGLRVGQAARIAEIPTR
jgi:HlyD family secretion protein